MYYKHVEGVVGYILELLFERHFLERPYLSAIGECNAL